MPLFLWKKSYEIGLPEIDVQHRRLVGMINELSDAMLERKGQRAVPHILDELVDYIQLHFTTEESAMQARQYPALDQHSKAHLELTRKVLAYKDRYAREHDLNTPELLDFLCGWLKDHIMVSDKDFGRFAQGEKTLRG